MSRLFLAVWPPEEAVAELRALRRKDQRGVRFLPPENWHVTLRFLGDSSIDDVVAAMEGVELPAAVARMGAGVDVLHDRVLMVPVHGLDDLAAAVVRATHDIGDPPPKRRFTGHLTIARLKRPPVLPPAMGALVTAEWRVEEVALVQSRLHPDGARYETVETWPVG